MMMECDTVVGCAINKVDLQMLEARSKDSSSVRTLDPDEDRCLTVGLWATVAYGASHVESDLSSSD